MRAWLQCGRGIFSAVMVLALIYGCASTPRPAPVREGTPSVPEAKRAPAATTEPGRGPKLYTVKKGDTLFSIALDHGLDYKDLVEWNNIGNSGVIQPGQQLRLEAPASAVVAAPLKSAPAVDGRPVGRSPSPPVVAGDAVKSQPKGVKVPYSDQALAQLSGTQVKPAAPDTMKADPRPEEKPAPSGDEDDNVDWGWPAGGKMLSTFNENTNLKGIGIAGKLGQPVIASAPGKVLYSGDGIRGYGKLVIVKHNKAYLSVYAHNSNLLVKEGQSVVKGQKIAEMGSTDSDQVKLHFEIRRYGKPVDPLKLLPPERPAQTAP
jgi:lipoprotein NlpD